jgi:hypothetical protein
MNKPLFRVSLLFLIIGCYLCGCKQSVNEHGRDSFAYIQKHFSDPPSGYRPAPLWVWHGVVTKEKIREQLIDFKEKGIGGVFVHPRYGLITEYLSDEWFDLFDYTVKVAEDLDMLVWIYDENSFPSGFAGGHVPASMPESYNQGQALIISEQQVFQPNPDKRYLHVWKEEEDRAYLPMADPEKELGRTGRYFLFELIDYPQSKWYGGFSYVDLLVPGVTEKFLEITMEGYEQFSGKFGGRIPGVFTDEPNIAPPGGRHAIRWTPDLYERFFERWGYRLEDHLMCLFMETGNWKRVRHNYFQLLLQLFIDRWSKPWYAYTEANNLIWTGHYWEHGWPSPHHGGDNMAMYAWHQMPGIDLLFNTIDQEEYPVHFGDPRLVKELRSVANQMGRRRTLSETYGAAGWELSFYDMKRLGDWAYALGLNYLNPHLAYMTLLGDRKHDFPQSFSYHAPYWEQYRHHADYFSRLSMAFSTGEQINRILLLEPTTSTWMYYSSHLPNEEVRRIGNSFQDLLDKLEAHQVGYDLGSENIIKDHGFVRDGMFGINQRAYELVVLPGGMENIDRPTFQLLQSFLEQGGRVISLQHHPTYIDGIISSELNETIQQYPENWMLVNDFTDPEVYHYFLSSDIAFALPDHQPRKLFHMRRQLNDGQLLFLVNSSKAENARGSFTVKGADVVVLDAGSGKMHGYPHRTTGGDVSADFFLTPAGSLLLYIPEVALGLPEMPVIDASRQRSLEIEVVDIMPMEDNVLVLDYCHLQLPGKEEGPLMYFYLAGERVWQHHGFPDNPWVSSSQFKTELVDRDNFGTETGYTLTYPFYVAEGVELASLRAVAERPDLFRVRINGRAVDPLTAEWYLEKDFGVYAIGEHVTSGRNTISVEVSPMSIFAEVTPLFVTGNFSLAPAERGWIIELAKEMRLGTWKSQGYPFYSGGMAYSALFRLHELPQQALFVAGEWQGTITEVHVNGTHAGVIGWKPSSLDIGEYLQPGENEIKMIVYGSLKNLLGPHHLVRRRGIVTPWSFKYAPEVQPAGNEYDLLDYGMNEVFNISVVY